MTTDMKLVPVEPTAEMIDAACEHLVPAHDALACWRAMLAASPVAPAPVAAGWQAIESAPKDGSCVLVYVPSSQSVVGAWYCQETGLWPAWGDYATNDDGEPCNVGLPTHWMPLPAAPGEG